MRFEVGKQNPTSDGAEQGPKSNTVIARNGETDEDDEAISKAVSGCKDLFPEIASLRPQFAMMNRLSLRLSAIAG